MMIIILLAFELPENVGSQAIFPFEKGVGQKS
jgi:hypothetical protein